MRRRTLQLASILLLLVVLGSHISELVDYWDRTFETGSDVESLLIIVALSVGIVLTLAGTVIVLAFMRRSRASGLNLPSDHNESSFLIVPVHSSPPLTLRI